MLTIDALNLRRGSQLLLENSSAVIHAQQRVAIVGANGAGKTSLFKLLLKELTPDAGDFSLPGNTRIAHMAQEVEAQSCSAKDYVINGHKELRQLEHELTQADAAQDDHRIAHLHGQLDHIGAYEAPVTAEKLLHGLGFTQNEIDRPVSDFSGGWRIRLNLAQALMCPSDLLLLDEPTNHLDLDAILWLEAWLKQYQGTVLFISHDRDFIDSVATHVMHIEHNQLHQYKGGYSDFEVLRAQKLALQQAEYEKQQRRIGEIQSFVTRFKAKATKAKQAQSRVKELERMELIAPAHVDSPFRFSFPAADKTSSPLLNLSHVDLGYDAGKDSEKTILRDFTTSVLPGSRVGLLGPNGAGKSTLVKSLVGDLALIKGVRTEGEHLKIGYFAQHQLEALDLQASPFLHLQRARPQASDQDIRNFLGGFDFRGDKALDPITRFSGGEKARLALALIAWDQPNLLILDEPTNHLDLEMRHALTMAMQAFEGAVVLVSHDRHLLKNTVDSFWLVADGKVDDYDGDLKDYEAWLKDYQAEQRKQTGAKTQFSDNDVAVEVVSDAQNESAEAKKERKRLAAEQRQRLSPLKKRLDKIDAAMESSQSQLKEVEAELADTDIYAEANKDRLQECLATQASLKQELETLELEWFELSEEIEALSADML